MSSTKRNYFDGKLVSIIRQNFNYSETDGTVKLEFKYRKTSRCEEHSRHRHINWCARDGHPLRRHGRHRRHWPQSRAHRKLIARCLKLVMKNKNLLELIWFRRLFDSNDINYFSTTQRVLLLGLQSSTKWIWLLNYLHLTI